MARLFCTHSRHTTIPIFIREKSKNRALNPRDLIMIANTDSGPFRSERANQTTELIAGAMKINYRYRSGPPSNWLCYDCGGQGAPLWDKEWDGNSPARRCHCVCLSPLLPGSLRYVCLAWWVQWPCSEPIFGKGMRRSTFQWKKGIFSEKEGGNSVNRGFGKDFYRKGNSVKRFGPFTELPDSENWKVAVLIPFPKISSYFPENPNLLK